MEWIKCSDKMPNLFQKVLVWDGEYINLAALTPKAWLRNEIRYAQDYFTHWMPAPADPDTKRAEEVKEVVKKWDKTLMTKEFNHILKGLQENLEFITEEYEVGEHVQAQNAGRTAEVTLKALLFIRDNLMMPNK